MKAENESRKALSTLADIGGILSKSWKDVIQLQRENIERELIDHASELR